MIKVEKAEVELSETTVRSLLAAIDKAKKTIDFTNAPMPEGAISVYQWKVEQQKRGSVSISSEYSDISYRVRLETRPHSQESLGYQLDEIPEPEKFSSPKGFTLLGSNKKEKK